MTSNGVERLSCMKRYAWKARKLEIQFVITELIPSTVTLVLQNHRRNHSAKLNLLLQYACWL